MTQKYLGEWSSEAMWGMEVVPSIQRSLRRSSLLIDPDRCFARGKIAGVQSQEYLSSATTENAIEE